MILSTHAVLGGTAALLAPHNPLIAFAFGVISHFLSDAIPHWHYPLRSLEKKEDPMEHTLRFGRSFILDCFILAFECSLGILAVTLTAYLKSPEVIYAAFFGAIGGVLPDFLQLVFHIFPHSIMRRIQEFHKWIHSKKDLDHRLFLGLGSQLAIIALCLYLF